MGSKETFGARFARLRKAKKLTQEEIGSKLNISGQAISKWENNISFPDITMLAAISGIFNVSIDELCGKESKSEIGYQAEDKVNLEEKVLRIIINSGGGDKIRINLPVPLVILMINNGNTNLQINGGKYLENINWTQIIKLIENGVIGTLLEVESANGDIILITIE